VNTLSLDKAFLCILEIRRKGPLWTKEEKKTFWESRKLAVDPRISLSCSFFASTFSTRNCAHSSRLEWRRLSSTDGERRRRREGKI